MPSSKKKTSFFSDLRIRDRESCEKVIRNGGIVAMICAGIVAIFVGFGLFGNPTINDFDYVLDPWNTVDVVVIVVMGIFVFRKSRVASTLLVIYFVTSKAIMWTEMNKVSGPGFLMALVVFAYYMAAMRGTYIWHSTYKNAPPSDAAQQLSSAEQEIR